MDRVLVDHPEVLPAESLPPMAPDRARSFPLQFSPKTAALRPWAWAMARSPHRHDHRSACRPCSGRACRPFAPSLFSPDGAKLAAAAATQNVWSGTFKTWNQPWARCQEHKGAVFGVPISPDCKTLRIGLRRGNGQIWEHQQRLSRSWPSTSLHRSVIRTSSAFRPDNRPLPAAVKIDP